MSGWWLQPLAMVLIIVFAVYLRRLGRWVYGRLDRRSLGTSMTKGTMMAEKSTRAPEVPRDPSRYAVPFTLVGGPLDGQVVDVVLAALVGRDVGALTVADAEASSPTMRCEHRYERIPGAQQRLEYVSTEWVPQASPFVSTEIRGDDA